MRQTAAIGRALVIRRAGAIRRIVMRARRLAAASAVLAVCTACTKQLPDLPPSMVTEPGPSQVESVIFFIGDAGYADYARGPLMRRLSNDIEHWSAALARDHAVAVVFLGDNVYPAGLRVGTQHFEQDSAALESQVRLLAGPNARRHRSAGYFVAGNHDWGNARNTAGVDRLHAQETFLERRREAGTSVILLPPAGEPGPAVVDVGAHARMLLIDTAWWLLARDSVQKYQLFNQTEEIISSTTDRFIIFGAHHPFQSASAHAGFVPVWKSFGLRLLLARSGSIMQDLNSLVYRDLTNSLLNSFRAGPPLIFAGGHDHALQVIQNDSFPLPRFSIISGSGSKLSSVGDTEGMRYRAGAPGYMRVVVHHSGQVDLFVINAPPHERFLLCGGTGDELERCMVERTAAYELQFGMRLK